MANTLKDDMSEVKQDKDRAIADLSAEIDQLKSQLADLARTAKRTGKVAVADAMEVAGNQAERLRNRAAGYIDEADVAVREHPATAMGIAVGLGFLLGLVMSRR